MFLVGGGILTHGLPSLHHLFEHWAELISHGAAWYSWFSHVTLMVMNGLSGVLAGIILVVAVEAIAKLRGTNAPH